MKYFIAVVTMFLLVFVGVFIADKNTNETRKELAIELDNAPRIQEMYIPVQEYEHKITPSRSTVNIMNITWYATAYDLSIQCCGKAIGHPARGITSSGFNLNGLNRTQAMTVASVRYKAGTKLKLTFNDDGHKKYNGVYTVRDTGKFSVNIIDIYMGDFGEKVGVETKAFGKVEVKVEVLN